ncbi:hypothetical protein OPT61_g212 [Boeremia exigua]|uniref:Uncharacterized protein n=1 Tax=Boeremia exigua TaxID=749465 RepID=A0ACC2IUU7_9PLEO|nr:hypothetical protein OPT61_g212 [Boeremia exigua]
MHFFYCLQFVLQIIINASATVIPRDTIDPDNPEASDPKQFPTRFNRPPRPDNPYKFGLATAPDSCTDFQRPSPGCIKDLQAQPGGAVAFSGGELKWEKDHQYNFKRAIDFLAKKSFDIIVSCKDAKNNCSLKRDGKAVGGYAWTYHGWFGYKYQYIVMCDPFFQTDDLMYKINQVEDALLNGDSKMARRADWQKNSGQIFLHEMMHLEAVGQPHINDERVQGDENGPWAYGANKTHMLARRNLNMGGGATRASTNADSYAWLANSKYFYELTGYWPQPPNWKGDDMKGLDAPNTEAMTINLGVINAFTSDDEFTQRLNSILGDSDSSYSGPTTGRALSIAMITQINSHSGGMSSNNEWHFYGTSAGHAVGCDWDSDQVQSINSQGPSDIKLPSSIDPRNPPWPGGEYKLTIDGAECIYKCDGLNPGRLFCPTKEIACRENPQKSGSEGLLKCNSYTFFHPVVYCDF